ncbi:MAG: HD-GYP domain-containing protein, partial [bacterium]
LRPSDLEANTLSPARRAFLDALFRAHGISDRALRIRLWRADGRLLYSNVPESTPQLAARADLSTQNGFAAFLESRGRLENTSPGVVRFFVPVIVAGDERPIAAFEIFYDLTYLELQLNHISRTVWTAVPLGIFVLYASVFVLVRRASQRLLQQQADLIAAHMGTYESLASAIDAKDSYTGDHSTRVSRLAAKVTRALRVPAQVVEDVRIAARLHDLGKIGVPDAILMKPTRLTPEEWISMRHHAERGFEIVRRAPLSNAVKQAIRHSHERWDGTGYPSGLAGEAIPLIARIVAVVDAYEAMTSDRPYRKALPAQDALARLEAGSGTQFDPRMVRVFTQVITDSESPKAPQFPAAS